MVFPVGSERTVGTARDGGKDPPTVVYAASLAVELGGCRNRVMQRPYSEVMPVAEALQLGVKDHDHRQ